MRRRLHGGGYLRLISRGVLVAWSLVHYGCSPGHDPSRGPEVFDSSGITVVVNPPAMASTMERWELNPDPILEVGSEGATGEDGILFQVVGAFMVEGSREVVVGNKGTSEVLVFDSSGVLARRIGGYGQGPGELEGLYGLHPCSGGQFMVHEGRRASVFTLEGDLVWVTPPEWRDMFNFEGISLDCSSVLFMVPTPPSDLRPGRVESWDGTFLWGDLVTGERTELTTFPVFQTLGREVNGVLQWVSFPWWRRARWVVAGDRVLLATGEKAEVEVWDRRNGLVGVFRWPSPPTAITAADRAQNVRVRTTKLAEDPSRAPYIPPSEEIFVPELKPALWEMLIDRSGTLWVQEYPFWYGGWGFGWANRIGVAPVNWTVLDPAGRAIAAAAVPADIEILSVHGENIVALWRDSLMVEHVRVYRLQGPGSER